MPRALTVRALLAWVAAMPTCAPELFAQDPAPKAVVAAPPVPAAIGASIRARDAFRDSGAQHAEWVAAHGVAIEWLAAHVRGDGCVPATGEGARDGAADVAATAAALLAFASAGSTMQTGEHRKQVRAATQWLIDLQRPDGWRCDPAHESAGLVQALVAAAIVQACVDAAHRPLARISTMAMQPFVDGKTESLGEPLALAIAVVADRHLLVGDGQPSKLGGERFAGLLAANGTCSADAGSFPFVGALPGTREMAAVAVAMACRGTTAMPDTDPRWTALAARLSEMPKRFGKNGELLDAVTLWCASDVAFQLGGEARAAFERDLSARVVPRFAGAAATGSITFACGPKVLRNEAAETALTALALAAPWYRVGR